MIGGFKPFRGVPREAVLHCKAVLTARFRLSRSQGFSYGRAVKVEGSSSARREGGREASNARVCSSCRHWSPHALYPYVGFCRIHSAVTFDDYSCPSFERLSVDNGAGFYWCLDCRTRLPGDEAARHLRMGHRVYRSAYLEPDIREEIYDAF